MGAKAKKSLKKKMIKKVVAKRAVSRPTDEPSNFLPLEGGSAGRQLQGEKPVKNIATVLYIGRIPHGFYEDQMEGFFKQFGEIKHLRIVRNKKTGRSKHYGFIEFEDPEVAKVVADEIHGYLLFEHRLQLHLIPPERVPPKLWKGIGRWYKPFDWKEFARKKHNKDRTIEEHEKMVEGILKRNEERQKRIAAAGIEYECPDFVGMVPKAKKIKFDVEDED
ncbi:nucleolar protein 15 [Dioscorea alata]|uniref:Nucleolar protein 15 n=1 Tax=Dioscorea alata TaxID=55571 RepID=A0ACB7VSW7_DIOAL|nr:nucleolar protein 15 [Dioscorea alata]